MKQIDGIARYLSQLDSADRQGPTVPEASLYEALAPADFGCLAQEKTVSCRIVGESSLSRTTRSCLSAALLTR
jgi:hypothetical protein